MNYYHQCHANIYICLSENIRIILVEIHFYHNLSVFGINFAFYMTYILLDSSSRTIRIVTHISILYRSQICIFIRHCSHFKKANRSKASFYVLFCFCYFTHVQLGDGGGYAPNVRISLKITTLRTLEG